MKLGISVRLGLLLAGFGMLAAGLTGYYAYDASRTLLIQEAKQALLASTRVLARRVILTREEVSRNLLTLSGHPSALAVLRHGNPDQEAQLATLFHQVMAANPRYFQIRLISASDHGQERVRVERHGPRLVRVEGDGLQEKGHYSYVFDALKLPAGMSYMSHIAINHEHGLHSGHEQPTVQLAMQVAGEDGRSLGVIVISVDLNGMFALMAADLPKDYKLYFANRQGDYLIHPEPSRAFGFDRGRRILVQDEFAGTRGLVEGTSSEVLLEAHAGRNAGAPLLAAFISRPVLVASEETRLILGLAQPLASIQAQLDRLGEAMLRIVLGLFVVCTLLAVLMARAITRPINSMSAAVQGFADEQRADGLPLGRQDEIGVLARAFDHMREQILRQMAELRRSREELKHLAWHDTLTGLPNRALFSERMEQALAVARRDQGRLALMFIDIDHFKPINDSLGHTIGDQLLRALAGRIRDALRESDTAARIGGDEFMILLPHIQACADVVTVAEKIRLALSRPFTIASHDLVVSACIGISCYPQDGEDMIELSKCADQAMYRAKQQGRDAVVSYSPVR